MRLIPFLALLLVACSVDPPQNAAEIIDDEAGIEATDDDRGAKSVAPRPARTKVGALHIQYDEALLAPFPSKVAVPPDWKQEVDGVKLIGRDRAQLIGKAECLYGQSGEARDCNVPQEAGLSFATLETPFADLQARLPAEETKPIVLAGVKGLSWQIGAEGEGAEYILLPEGGGSILIVRQFRAAGNPNEAALGAVLGDLRIGA
ncbi:MAG: hypothetical protein H0W74_07810 [Sphingosinicella sp.]|nr:hypothetical protein [Sphingosinicella sp.]